MPRVFDPSRDDPTIKFITSITEFLEEQKYKLNDKEMQSFIQQRLKTNKYTSMMKSYLSKNQEFPDIILKSSCSKGHFFWLPYASTNTKFPARFNPHKNEIVLCKNSIKNLLELQENLDRELTLAYDHNILKKNLHSSDADFACSQMRACHAQLDNYTKLDEPSKKSLSNTCARYLLRHRGPNEEKLPHDLWVRYAEKMADKFEYCYSLSHPFKQTN